MTHLILDLGARNVVWCQSVSRWVAYAWELKRFHENEDEKCPDCFWYADRESAKAIVKEIAEL